MNARRWLVPVTAALAVLVVLGGLWWLTSRGPAQPVDPGSPGGPSGPLSLSPGPGQTDQQGVVIDSYFTYDETHLAINYTTGVAACYGRVDDPVVEESAVSVTVTLTRLPVKQKKGVACIDIALVKSVDITLDFPLGDRVVRDGSAGGRAVQPGSAPNDPNQAK